MRDLPSGLADLRVPFDPSQINKLPKGLDKTQPKSKCGQCGGYHEPASVHLDYVSHANVTERLLDVDPLWSYEPVAFDKDGLPLTVRNSKGNPVGLWIRLTVCGITRFGYGSCDDKPDAIKELIGDALRNASMRFGVALDLWKKESAEEANRARHTTLPQAQPQNAPHPVVAGQPGEAGRQSPDRATDHDKKRLCRLADNLGWDVHSRHARAGVTSFDDLTKAQARELEHKWQKLLNENNKASAMASKSNGGDAPVMVETPPAVAFKPQTCPKTSADNPCVLAKGHWGPCSGHLSQANNGRQSA